MQWGDVAAWFGAVATLLAIVVALFIALRPEWLQRKRRPRLCIEVGEIEPFVRPVFNGTHVDHYRFRVGIRNNGATTASHAKVTIERWWSWAGRPKLWTDNAIDPVPAAWIGHSSGESDALTLDIPPGGRQLCDLLRWEPNRPRLSLAIDARRRVTFPVDGGPYGEQRLALNVSCDNAEGIHVVVSVTPVEHAVDAANQSRRSPLTSVDLVEEPNPADVQHVGLLGLWSPPQPT